MKFSATTTCLIFLSVIAGGFTLYALGPVLSPFILAVMIAIGIMPVRDFLEDKLKFPRVMSMLTTMLLALLFIGLVWWIVIVSASDLTSRSEAYSAQIRNAITRLAEWSQLSDEMKAEILESVRERATVFTGSLSSSLMNLASYAIVVSIYLFFLLLGSPGNDSLKRPFLVEIERHVQMYLVLKAVISAGTGLVFGVMLWLFDIPLAIVFGLLAVFLNFIPNIGPVIAAALPIPLIIADPDMSPWIMGVVIGLSCAIQVVSGNVIEPRIMGQSFNLHPIVVLLTLLFFGHIWGIVGMLIATPLVSVIKIALSRFESTKPIAEAMAGNYDALVPKELDGDPITFLATANQQPDKQNQNS